MTKTVTDALRSDAVFAMVLHGQGVAPEVAGGKAGGLDRLIAWGFPVPPTGVVTTDVYRRVVGSPEVDTLISEIRAGREIPAAEVDRVFLAADLAGGLAEEIAAVAREVGDGRPLAVRSSATAEDTAVSSFAGQYRTLLEIDPTDVSAVLRAVRLVFASLWHPAPVAYRRAFGIDDAEIAMAAVIMQMVPAVTAGVVFTVDPAGDEGLARVEAVRGLGEQLVSGQATPDAYVVSRDHPAADLPAEVREALDLSLRVERRAGCAQDVEWVFDGDRGWLVQARPITTVGRAVGDGFDSDITEDELTTAGIGEMLPGVLPPLLAHLNIHMVEEAFRRLLDDLGTKAADFPADPIIRRIHGRAALNYGVLRDMATALPGGAAEELELQYFGSRRAGRPTARDAGERGVRGRVRTVLHDLRVLRTRRRALQDAEVVIAAAAELLEVVLHLRSLETRDLLARRARLIDLGVRGTVAELEVAAVAASTFRRLELMLEPHLGADRATAAAEQVTAGVGVMADRNVQGSAGVFAGPTWLELGTRPPTFEAGSHGDALDQLERRLGSLPSWSKSDLVRWVRTAGLRNLFDDAVHQLGRREATKAAILSIGGLVRTIHLEIGRRLVANGVLDRPDEIDLLRDDELRAALTRRAPGREELRRRARWLDRYAAEGPLPPKFSGSPVRRQIELPPGDRLEGWATSPGRVSGFAQVVASPTDAFEAGRILVAEATDASWSPLFVDAAGVVLERGGPLSHAAILARELQIPAVLNVAGATKWLDGAFIVIDGEAGVVVRSEAE